MKKVCDYCEDELVYRQMAAIRVDKKTSRFYRPICWGCWKLYSCLQNNEKRILKLVRKVSYFLVMIM